MDRYLFKGKRVDNGKWVIGNLVYSVYKKDDICIGQYGNGIGMHTVIPETICQCTGLKDKHGNLIWENDVIKKEYYANYDAYENPQLEEYKGYIKNEEGTWRIAFINNDGNECMIPIFIFEREGLTKDDLECIGNVFDTPELIPELIEKKEVVFDKSEKDDSLER